MYLKDSDQTTPTPLQAPALVGAIALCALVTLVLGIFPGPFIDLAKQSLLPLPP
jgi:NADH:ubiquinone oxidoreductase subunit 2 (subunit N)